MAKFPARASCARSSKSISYNIHQPYSSPRRIVPAAQGPRRDSAPSQRVPIIGTTALALVTTSLALNVYLLYVIGEYQSLGSEFQELTARANTLNAMADKVQVDNAKNAVRINELKDFLKESGEP